jgi:hypothetical protein
MSYKGKFVRKYDKIGRPYYLPRFGGQRVSFIIWKTERDQIAFARARGKAIIEDGKPFPLGSTSEGVPDTFIDEDGESYEAFPIVEEEVYRRKKGRR